MRRWRVGEPVSDEALETARDVLYEFRAAHGGPLIKATNGLRSMVRTEGFSVEVSQRLKRFHTIVDKLGREPTMALARMQDIGGCRAILANIDELRRVEKRVRWRRPPVNVSDYISSPRASGYRAVHLVVTYDGRCVEIQLRTRLMHEWAVAVERFGGRMNEDLKSGRGPRKVIVWLEAVAGALALEDGGETVDSTFMDRIAQLRHDAMPYLAGGS